MKKRKIRLYFMMVAIGLVVSCANVDNNGSSELNNVQSIDEKYIGTYKTKNNDILIVTNSSVSFNGTVYSFNDFRSPEELAEEYPCKLIYKRSSSDLGSGCVWKIYDYDWINHEPIFIEEYYDPEDCSIYQYRDVIYSEEEWNQKILNLDFNEPSFPFLEIKVNLDGISADRRHYENDKRKSLIKVDDNKYIFFDYSSIYLEIYENKSIDLYKTKTAYQFTGVISNNQFDKYTTSGYWVYDLYKGDDLIRMSTGEKNWLEKTFDEPYKTVERLSCSTVWFEKQIENIDDDNNNSNDENSESDNDCTIIGTYSFTNATPPQMNGSITLSNGNWSYSGEKSSPAASNGTYTVSKNEITVNWNASGYEVSETFTITESGSNSTWKSKNTVTSTFFSMLFGVTSLEMNFTKS